MGGLLWAKGLAPIEDTLSLLGHTITPTYQARAAKLSAWFPCLLFREVGTRWRKRPRRHSYLVSLDYREVCEQPRTGEVLTTQYSLAGGEGVGTGESRGWTGKADLSSRLILC